MSLPDSVEQTIQKIITLTAKDEPNLYQPLYDELSQQFDQLLGQEIISILPDNQINIFQQLLVAKPQPNIQAISQFLQQHHIDNQAITEQARQKLVQQYLESE